MGVHVPFVGNGPPAGCSARDDGQDGAGHHQVAQEFADGHVEQAGPEGKPQPAGHGAQRVADGGQPAEQAGLGAELAQPDAGTALMAGQCAGRRVSGVGRMAGLAACACQGPGLLGTQAHPPADGTAQRVAQGGHANGLPEQLGVELQQTDHGRLGAQRQQGGRYQGHDEECAQTELRQGQPLQQLVHPDFHGVQV